MKITIDQHRASPDVSLESYTRSCQIQLAISLERKRAIYLDLKFWIALRDAAMGVSGDTLSLELLCALRQLVSNGKAYCPISESTFFEVFKQGAALTRRATTTLVDELSLGVTLIPLDLRIGTEIAYFIHSKLTPDHVHPLPHLVWTKLSYVLGYVHPTSTQFDPATELAVQKAFFDHMWTISLTEMNDRIGAMERIPHSFDTLAVRLNSENKKHAATLRSFEHTYSLELNGVLDLYAERAADVLSQIAQRATGSSAAKGGPEWIEQERACRNLLIAAFKQDATKDVLRTIHINTCLHACVRWNKLQQFKTNDFFDFHHAAAALGYCDAFFTERPLCAMVKRSDIALDRRYDCHVGSTLSEAIAYLKTVA